MIRSLWIAKTGLDAQQTQLDVVSNNLANVGTTGFKRSRAVFEDLMYQNLRQVGGQTSDQTRLPSGLQIGTGVRVVATERITLAGQPDQDRQPARRGHQRQRLLPGADARRHHLLHARRLVPDRPRTASW
jgi:flagellar basal-body rod protein FlgG